MAFISYNTIITRDTGEDRELLLSLIFFSSIKKGKTLTIFIKTGQNNKQLIFFALVTLTPYLLIHLPQKCTWDLKVQL